MSSYLSLLLPQIPQMSWRGEAFHLHISCSMTIRGEPQRVPPSPPPSPPPLPLVTCAVPVQLTVPLDVGARPTQEAAADLRGVSLPPVLVLLPRLVFAVFSCVRSVSQVLGPLLRIPSLLGPAPGSTGQLKPSGQQLWAPHEETDPTFCAWGSLS